MRVACAGIALHKLARAYERRGEADAAARCHEANLARIDAAGAAGQDALDALIFLAGYRKVRGSYRLRGGCTGSCGARAPGSVWHVTLGLVALHIALPRPCAAGCHLHTCSAASSRLTCGRGSVPGSCPLPSCLDGACTF